MKRAMGDCTREKLVAGWLAPAGLAGWVVLSLSLSLSLSVLCVAPMVVV